MEEVRDQRIVPWLVVAHGGRTGQRMLSVAAGAVARLVVETWRRWRPPAGTVSDAWLRQHEIEAGKRGEF